MFSEWSRRMLHRTAPSVTGGPQPSESTNIKTKTPLKQMCIKLFNAISGVTEASFSVEDAMEVIGDDPVNNDVINETENGFDVTIKEPNLTDVDESEDRDETMSEVYESEDKDETISEVYESEDKDETTSAVDESEDKDETMSEEENDEVSDSTFNVLSQKFNVANKKFKFVNESKTEERFYLKTKVPNLTHVTESLDESLSSEDKEEVSDSTSSFVRNLSRQSRYIQPKQLITKTRMNRIA